MNSEVISIDRNNIEMEFLDVPADSLQKVLPKIQIFSKNFDSEYKYVLDTIPFIGDVDIKVILDNKELVQDIDYAIMYEPYGNTFKKAIKIINLNLLSNDIASDNRVVEIIATRAIDIAKTIYGVVNNSIIDIPNRKNVYENSPIVPNNTFVPILSSTFDNNTKADNIFSNDTMRAMTKDHNLNNVGGAPTLYLKYTSPIIFNDIAIIFNNSQFDNIVDINIGYIRISLLDIRDNVLASNVYETTTPSSIITSILDFKIPGLDGNPGDVVVSKNIPVANIKIELISDSSSQKILSVDSVFVNENIKLKDTYFEKNVHIENVTKYIAYNTPIQKADLLTQNNNGVWELCSGLDSPVKHFDTVLKHISIEEINIDIQNYILTEPAINIPNNTLPSNIVKKIIYAIDMVSIISIISEIGYNQLANPISEIVTLLDNSGNPIVDEYGNVSMTAGEITEQSVMAFITRNNISVPKKHMLDNRIYSIYTNPNIETTEEISDSIKVTIDKLGTILYPGFELVYHR